MAKALFSKKALLHQRLKFKEIDGTTLLHRNDFCEVFGLIYVAAWAGGCGGEELEGTTTRSEQAVIPSGAKAPFSLAAHCPA